jgi:cold shock protein
MMPRGKVKWFNDAKGYGFIVPEDGGNDVFAHHTECPEVGGGFRSLTIYTGKEVTYEIVQTSKGVQAASVQPVEKA